MRTTAEELYAELERVPEDWSVRLRLVNWAVSIGNQEEAKRLVRESPGDEPLPQELQAKIYSLLSGETSYQDQLT